MSSVWKSYMLQYASILVIFGMSVISAAAADTYQLDATHSYIMFRIKHFGIGYSYGSFINPTGKLVIDDNEPANSVVEIEVQAKNVSTFFELRDKHIKSADFLNVNKFPIVVFKSQSVKKTGPDQYEIAGDMLLLGKKRPLTITAVQTGRGKDPWGAYRIGYETMFTIKRSDFGMNFMMGGLSDEVQLTVSVEGVRQ